MNELDRKIEEALSEQDRALMAHFGEQGLFAQLGSLFQGKMGWMIVILSVASFIMLVVGIYGAWKFATTPDLQTMVRWGGVAWLGLMGHVMTKNWNLQRMETNRILREVKRLELQIARMKAG